MKDDINRSETGSVTRQRPSGLGPKDKYTHYDPLKQTKGPKRPEKRGKTK